MEGAVEMAKESLIFGELDFLGIEPSSIFWKSGGALAGDWMLQQGGDVQKRPKGGGGIM